MGNVLSNKLRPAIASLNLAASEGCPGIDTPSGPYSLTCGLKLETLETPVSRSHESAMLPRNTSFPGTQLEQVPDRVLFDRMADTKMMSSGRKKIWSTTCRRRSQVGLIID